MKKLIFALSLSVLLSGCSASVDGGTDPFANWSKPDTFETPAINGPDVVGTWKSACVKEVFGDYRQAMITYLDKSNFSYENTSYSDSECKTVVESEKHAGLYQFSKELSEHLYVIDYRYVEDGVTYHMNGQQLQISGDTIYISEFVFGDTSVDLNVPFTKVAQ